MGGVRHLWLVAVMLLGLFPAMQATADEIRPALLDIKEQNTGLFAVTWKVPTRNNQALAIAPQLPQSLELIGSPTVQDVPGARVEHASYRNTGESLTGQTILIEGLAAVQTDVLLLVQLKDGGQHSAILRPASPAFTIPLEASKLEVAADYWLMGTVHILEGADHLLFVLALLLIVNGFGPLLKAVTAFTVAHSITLALATLDVIQMPSAPTEAIIALSILFLAAEIVHKHNGQLGVTERWPWLIAFLFGLFPWPRLCRCAERDRCATGRGAAGAADVQRRRGDRAAVVHRRGVGPDRAAETAANQCAAGCLAGFALQHRRSGGLLDDRSGHVIHAGCCIEPNGSEVDGGLAADDNSCQVPSA